MPPPSQEVQPPSFLEWAALWTSGFMEDIRTFRKIRPGSTYIVAHPKTGTTWLRFMMVQLIVNRYDLNTSELSVRLNRISNRFSSAPDVHWTHDDASLGPEEGPRDDPERLMAYGWRFRYARSRVILLVRDPRDIVTSYYHWLTNKWPAGTVPSSLSAFIRHPVFGIDRVVRFLQIWDWNRRLPSDFMVLTYEDLNSDHGAQFLHRVARFAGIDVAISDVRRVYERSRADQMRRLEKEGQIDGMSVPTSENRNALKVRKAKTGTYKEELSEADQAYCRERARHIPDHFRY